MPSPRRPCARSWPVAACLALVACISTEDLTSPSPSTPWRPQQRYGLLLPPEPEQAEQEEGLSRRFVSPVDPALPIKEEAVTIDPGHDYTLAELIDIAQRSNKQTRVAWEAARQAAITVGIALGAYLPDVTSHVIGGYQRLNSPFPNDLVRQGFIESNVAEVLPGITVKWLLFDFGGRSQAVAAAEQLTIAANAEFTAVHQKLIFDVARTYFELDAVDTQLAAAREALTNARRVEKAATSLYGRGVGTIVAQQQAHQQVAKGEFEVEQAIAAQHRARLDLLQAMGVSPATQLKTVSSADRPLPATLGTDVDAAMRLATTQRPDLLAQIAKLRAADAEILRARSTFYPTLGLEGNIQQNIATLNVNGSGYSDVNKPIGGIFLRLTFPLYQGGIRERAVELARSRHEAAASELQFAQDRAMHEAALAYDQVQTGIAEYRSAEALNEASRVAFDSTLAAYENGVGTITNALIAQTALAQARALVARVHAQVLTSAAALAFATGALVSSNSPGIEESLPAAPP
jgi:outer membrane protein TolC